MSLLLIVHKIFEKLLLTRLLPIIEKNKLIPNTGDLPTSLETTSTTFADDTAVLVIDNNPSTASSKSQSSFLEI
jgi:hypothetical protein